MLDALQLPYDIAMRDPEIAAMVRAMMVRTRFVDEGLEHALDAGVSQVLVLGAGFDSHAYRFADELDGARIFELDRPKTLAVKRERVIEALGRLPANVTYVDADLESNDIEIVLKNAGYDFSRLSFVLMEGLTMYLHEAELRAAFSLVASHAPGSSVVFDFVTNAMVAGIKSIDVMQAPEAARPFLQRFIHMIRDEPFEFGFPVGEESQYIEQLGLAIEDLIIVDDDEAARRYLTRADGSQVGEEGLANQPPIPEDMARARRETMSYRICEALVPQKH
jgi:methyltransferase (TIGR00027 family)